MLHFALTSLAGEGEVKLLVGLRNVWSITYNNVMQRYTTELSRKSRTFVPDMETKIETKNTGGKVLALDGEELVGRLEFSFDGNVMSIDHTYAFKKGIGIGGTLVSAANDYAVSKGLKVKPVCSFASAWYERHPQFGDILDRAI
jgi:predicted GNAT family acetyltransferase